MLKQKKFKRGKSPLFNKGIKKELLSYQRKKTRIVVPERICIPEIIPKITDSDIFLLKKTLAEKSLIEFIKQGWNVLEPNNPFADGWHLHAICEHLEAVASGQIKKLLINIPPRHCKSLAVSVFFPCWLWTKFPEKRTLFSSYSSDLSQRDGRKCLILLNSEWYRKNWAKLFVLDKETDFKIENSKRGYRIATSVGGMTTGEGGDFVCFPYDEIVQTEKGKMKIGDIVENKISVKVWSVNLKSGNPELKEIEGWKKNRASDMVQITFNDGSSIRCTPDHKIWTTKGYVMAQNLTSSDMLPYFTSKDISNINCINIKQSGKLSLRQRGASYFSNLLFRKFCCVMSFAMRISGSSAFFFSNRRPRSFTPNVINSLSCNFVFSGKTVSAVFAFKDNKSLFSGQNSPRSLFKNRESSVSLGVSDIFTSCSVSKIGKGVIGRIAIKMSDFLTFDWSSHKSKKHCLMNKSVNVPSLFSCIKSWVSSFACNWGFHNHFFKKMLIPPIVTEMSKSLDSASRGNLVQSFKSRYIFPVFVEFCFHSESSYCLTVKDNHNFVVSTSQGENNIVVANCTDDPHSAKEIESDVKRIAVLRWWDEVMSTRLNDQKTGVKIIIMQRLHEKDLAGHVLSKDDSYVHLCLPARYEVNGERTRTVIPFKDPRTQEGEVLWEAKFADKELSSLEKELGEYARAGQLQQRPSPRGGGLFKVVNFVKKTVCNFDEVKRAVRYWDKAGTELGGCFTCGVLMFWMRDGSFFVYDIVAGQWNSSDREKHIERVIKADTYHCKRYKYSYACWVEQEPGSAGKESALATIRRLAGYRVYADRVTGSKESRATDFAVQVEIGNVSVLDTSWTNVYFERMEFYPMGEYKDWGDASSGAFNKLIRAKLAGSWGSRKGKK